ncbi:MAG: hypothetical protein JO303_10950 [Caulobacteraceae bacterium]|nr:hypothetical protein [Caulobacteraceae bacterium]
MLGSSADTLTLQGSGSWMEMASFKAGDALPTGALALSNGATLDAVYGAGKAYTAETALDGYVFEQVGAKGKPVKYLTVYTDATIVSTLASPSATVFAQAISAYGAAGGTYTGPATPPPASPTGVVIAAPTA